MTESDFGWWPVVPPVLGIALAIATRQVVGSLLAGVVAGWIILAQGHPLGGLAAALECLVGVFAVGWQTKVILFTNLSVAMVLLLCLFDWDFGPMRRAEERARPEGTLLRVGAVLGGGVFGDHCSPISDTSIVSSMAACSDHMDHVRTQLPYALTAAMGALVLYLVVGVVL